jgi:hypothetical protein
MRLRHKIQIASLKKKKSQKIRNPLPEMKRKNPKKRKEPRRKKLLKHKK